MQLSGILKIILHMVLFGNKNLMPKMVIKKFNNDKNKPCQSLIRFIFFAVVFFLHTCRIYELPQVCAGVLGDTSPDKCICIYKCVSCQLFLLNSWQDTWCKSDDDNNIYNSSKYIIYKEFALQYSNNNVI